MNFNLYRAKTHANYSCEDFYRGSLNRWLLAAVVCLLIHLQGMSLVFAQEQQGLADMPTLATDAQPTSDFKSAEAAPPASPDEYRLGAGDRLKIQIHERVDLSGEYRVGFDGRMGLPLLGSFVVGGKTVAQVTEEITAAYVAATKRKPALLIEIAEYRPIYVVGVVRNSAAYQFVPTMTVLHALALAGGVAKAGLGDVPSSQSRDLSREMAKLQQSTANLKWAIARSTRLLAERADRTTIEPSESLRKLADEAEIEALMASEKRIMEQVAAAHKERREGLERVILRIKEELEQLSGQEKQERQKIEYRNQELGDLQTLNDKGLSKRSQVLGMQALIATYEAELLDVGSRKSRAARGLEEAERDLATLDLDRKVAVEKELVETNKQIEAMQIEIAASQNFIEQATGMPAELSGLGAEPKLKYTIVRKVDGRYDYISADEVTPLHPGDILRVWTESSFGQTTYLKRDLKDGASQ